MASRADLLGKLADLMPDAPSDAEAEEARKKALEDEKAKGQQALSGTQPKGKGKTLVVPVAKTTF